MRFAEKLLSGCWRGYKRNMMHKGLKLVVKHFSD
jgi:hypothetical protein